MVFKGNPRTIGIKFNRINLAIVKGGDYIAHPALCVKIVCRKGLFNILFHCCEICAGVAPGGLIIPLLHLGCPSNLGCCRQHNQGYQLRFASCRRVRRIGLIRANCRMILVPRLAAIQYVLLVLPNRRLFFLFLYVLRYSEWWGVVPGTMPQRVIYFVR